MKAYVIQDVKKFMSKLLAGEMFDQFLLSEAVICMGTTFRIDGRVNREFYDNEAYEQLPEEESRLAKWKSLRPVCFELIKGKQLPLSFRFVMELAEGNVEKLLEQSGVSFTQADVGALALNIRYDTSGLKCVTGTALNIFSLDKSLEQAWDAMVGRFLYKNEIAFEEQL